MEVPAANQRDDDLEPESRALLPPPDGLAQGVIVPTGLCQAGALAPATDGGSPASQPQVIDADRFLLPACRASLDRLKHDRAGKIEPVRIIPRAPEYYAEKITFVENLAGAEAMLDFARQRAIAYIGGDCEFRYARPGVLIKKDRWWYDPTSIVPLLMAIVLVETEADGSARLYRFVIDLRPPAVLGPLGELFRLPIPFVGHFLPAELFCLWKLGVPIPDTIWDTCTAERAFQLGIYHARYKKEKVEDEGEQARLKEEAEEDVEFSCGLIATCTRRGVLHAFASHKNRLQKSFLDHADGAAFSEEQIAYVSADAEAAARLYPIQVQVAVTQNAHRHLFEVEMPWTVTNASMIWNGVHVDADLLDRLGRACSDLEKKLTADLAGWGVGNVNSHPDMCEFFRTIGLLEAFREGDSYTFDDNHLKAVEDRHDAIPMIRALRKIKRLRSDKLLTGELTGSDGRLHPNHRQLGAESGRNSMSLPNIGGIGRALRPLVTPGNCEVSTPVLVEDANTADACNETPGAWGIGEVDLSQIEVLIAAAESNDRDLIAMVNGKDVYCAMVRSFYAESLSPEDLTLPDKDFGKRFKHYRDRMKIFTLATIYNITPFGLSRQRGISEQRAKEERAQFLALFPVLDRALREMSAYGAIRGYAELRTGLRRHRARSGRPTPWEVNWLRNTPIQGSASVVFKIAGNRLYRRYPYYGARLILPLHDAFVFECPLAHLGTVAGITAEVMKGCVQEIYPMLDPQVDVNIEQPHCWNKDGKAQSLALWMEDPALARAYLR